MTRLGMALNGGKGKKTQDDFVDFMNEPLPTLVDASDVVCSPELDDSAPLVRSIASAADKRKGSDIVAMRVSKVTATTSFMVFATGNSRPQNDAIAKSIIDGVIEEHDGRRIKGDGGPEGTSDSGWILLDYGDVMVHVMTPKSRLFYDIEGQWRRRGGEDVDLSDVLLPDVPASPPGLAMEEGQPQMGGGMADVSEEDDPFWS